MRDRTPRKRVSGQLSPFGNRYVLGTGFPWANGTSPYLMIGVTLNRIGIQHRPLDFPKELWMKNVPQYRLVLEKVHKGRTRKS